MHSWLTRESIHLPALVFVSACGVRYASVTLWFLMHVYYIVRVIVNHFKKTAFLQGNNLAIKDGNARTTLY